MGVVIKREGAVVVARLTGALDHIAARELEAAVGLPGAAGLRLVLELSRAGPVASSGVAGLIKVHDDLERSGGRLVIAAPAKAVRAVLELTELLATFKVAETVEEAVRLAGG
jgi:anti-anti-sigma factor